MGSGSASGPAAGHSSQHIRFKTAAAKEEARTEKEAKMRIGQHLGDARQRDLLQA